MLGLDHPTADETWSAAGLGPQLHRLALAAYDQIIGLELADILVDGCISKSPLRRREAASPVDRGKQGLNAPNPPTPRHPHRPAIRPANRHDSPLLAATLDNAIDQTTTRWPADVTVHLERRLRLQPKPKPCSPPAASPTIT